MSDKKYDLLPPDARAIASRFAGIMKSKRLELFHWQVEELEEEFLRTVGGLLSVAERLGQVSSMPAPFRSEHVRSIRQALNLLEDFIEGREASPYCPEVLQARAATQKMADLALKCIEDAATLPHPTIPHIIRENIEWVLEPYFASPDPGCVSSTGKEPRKIAQSIRDWLAQCTDSTDRAVCPQCGQTLGTFGKDPGKGTAKCYACGYFFDIEIIDTRVVISPPRAR